MTQNGQQNVIRNRGRGGIPGRKPPYDEAPSHCGTHFFTGCRLPPRDEAHTASHGAYPANHMLKTVPILNNKDGVGKTTTAVSTAGYPTSASEGKT
jgi:hypothetical protein